MRERKSDSLSPIFIFKVSNCNRLRLGKRLNEKSIGLKIKLLFGERRL